MVPYSVCPHARSLLNAIRVQQSSTAIFEVPNRSAGKDGSWKIVEGVSFTAGKGCKDHKTRVPTKTVWHRLSVHGTGTHPRSCWVGWSSFPCREERGKTTRPHKRKIHVGTFIFEASLIASTQARWRKGGLSPLLRMSGLPNNYVHRREIPW